MGYGVVNMKNVELMIAAHFRHFHREWQCIIGILEQSIVIDQHRMKIESRAIKRHSERAPIANEMHLVAALRQLFAELRGQNAASTNGRVTGDPYLQLTT